MIPGFDPAPDGAPELADYSEAGALAVEWLVESGHTVTALMIFGLEPKGDDQSTAHCVWSPAPPGSALQRLQEVVGRAVALALASFDQQARRDADAPAVHAQPGGYL